MSNSSSPEHSRTLAKALEAARSGVVVFDVSDRTQIELTGTDHVRFLNGFASNDIKRLKPGQGCETFMTNLKGKVVAHVFAFRKENATWLDGMPGQQEAILAHLGKFVLIDDVQMIPRTECGELFVSGPLAAQLLQLENEMSVGDHVSRGADGELFDIRRVDLLRVPGFLLSASPSKIEEVKRSLLAIGVAEGSRELFEFLRIEAGYPLFGTDITDDNLAQEVARTKQCISFNKGCYLGQETVARIDALGHTNRELRRIEFDSVGVPTQGTYVYDESGTTEVGMVTSASRVIEDSPPDHGAIVAIGMLKRAACQPNTVVRLKFGDREATGKVL